MSSVLLEQEQEELLKALVEASRNVPRDQREEFHILRDGDGSSVMHPGIPGRQMRVNEGDIDILQTEGLLLVTQIGHWHRSFVVTPHGSALYEEIQHRSGAPAQQVEETLMRYLDSEAFQRSYPDAHRKWAEAAELLWKSDSQQQLTTIGHLCREAIQEFATALVERHQPPGVDQAKAHDINRIQAVVDQRRSQLGTTAALLDALVAYWRAVSGFGATPGAWSPEGRPPAPVGGRSAGGVPDRQRHDRDRPGAELSTDGNETGRPVRLQPDRQCVIVASAQLSTRPLGSALHCPGHILCWRSIARTTYLSGSK